MYTPLVPPERFNKQARCDLFVPEVSTRSSPTQPEGPDASGPTQAPQAGPRSPLAFRMLNSFGLDELINQVYPPEFAPDLARLLRPNFTPDR